MDAQWKQKLKESYKENKEVRNLLFPALTPVFAFGLPLIYQLKLFWTDEQRLGAYLFGALLALILAGLYKYLENDYVKELINKNRDLQKNSHPWKRRPIRQIYL